ncbi:D-3-phosphoglycerate dehydrogenase-like [Ostrea edulis]|uniref:D-3-phosphoglycerate dehydrogenase-like n=1 Tax=Ostrea edulis TaxID=37623 RepID=UPI0020951F00|nr:D-3-phosphoglycerate dehydrogenase-like [Ostrea edulis]
MSINLTSVLISDEVDQKCVNFLQENGIKVVKNTKLSKEELLKEIANHDGLIVRSATKVTAEVIAAGKKLKIIGRAGTGVDNIDCNEATKRGIIVMNTPGGNTLSAAELTCTLICCVSRNVHSGDRAMKEKKWSERKALMGSELYGKTLGIVGLGRIGKEVALRMQSFGMKTIGFDPIIPGEVSEQFGVKWMQLEELWPLVDYITVHTPLIPQTRNLINDAVFGKCKKGVKVINVARGGIIEEAAILRALESGQCGGAGLDVFTSEPPADFTLAQHPKVVATPHLGASTSEAQERVAVEIAEQFVDLNKGKQLFGAINANAMTNALSEESRAWVTLGQRLGQLAGSVGGQSTGTIKVTACGSSLKEAKSYLGAAVLAGYLATRQQPSGDGITLNLVNAPVMAKEQNLQVEFSQTDDCSGQYSATVTVKISDGFQASGTTCSGGAVLLSLQGQGFPAPASLSGTAVVFSAKGSPQLMASISGAVAGESVTSLTLSSGGAGDRWGVATFLAPPSLKNMESLKGVTTTMSAVTF